jgi:hypothetical protein
MTTAPNTDAAATATAKVRKAPTQSSKAKLRWNDGIATITTDDDKTVEVGRQVKLASGKYSAVVKVGAKKETLATEISGARAYSIIVSWYHKGERPAVKVAKAQVKKAS